MAVINSRRRQYQQPPALPGLPDMGGGGGGDDDGAPAEFDRKFEQYMKIRWPHLAKMHEAHVKAKNAPAAQMEDTMQYLRGTEAGSDKVQEYLTQASIMGIPCTYEQALAGLVQMGVTPQPPVDDLIQFAADLEAEAVLSEQIQAHIMEQSKRGKYLSYEQARAAVTGR